METSENRRNRDEIQPYNFNTSYYCTSMDGLPSETTGTVVQTNISAFPFKILQF
jgi:hypothetical protein